MNTVWEDHRNLKDWLLKIHADSTYVTYKLNIATEMNVVIESE